jgi:predicted Zn-dependent protease
VGRIALRDYLNQISGLINESRLDEAIAHCRHILEQHPRHVRTYELLGKALLELENYQDASDIFQRVLSADPENVVSHAGLAIAYSVADDYTRAAWHMERAYDIDPYNQAILVELTDLYTKRDGAAPAQVDMTRTALARLYLKGSLLKLAAKELTSLLAEQPDRLDLKVLLAETYYRDNQKKAAANLAMKIVAILPLCVKANAILAGVWTATGRPDQAQQHLMRVRSVLLPQQSDLLEDTFVAEVLSQMDQLKLPREVAVEELDFVPVASAGAEEGTEWETSSEPGSSDSSDLNDWLQEFSRTSEED